jgi:hypothetical protein
MNYYQSLNVKVGVNWPSNVSKEGSRMLLHKWLCSDGVLIKMIET